MGLLQTKRVLMKKIFEISCLFVFLTVFSSCADNAGNEITNAITFTVSRQAIVAPSKITSPDNCPTEEVSGPRIRLRSSIKWEGNSRDLLPLSISIQIQSSQLSEGKYNQILTPTGSNESLAFVWDDLNTDFIPPGPKTYESRCFLDFSGLPRPTNDLNGNAQLKVRATITISGVARDTFGEDVPFVKTADTEVIYMSGSVPAQ